MNRYKEAHDKLFRELPSWKQKAIDEDLANKVESRLMDEFAKSVIELAESDKEIVNVTPTKDKKRKFKVVKQTTETS